jgi:hypothetical protein
MSTVQGGPGNIVTNGLVLYLDAANTRSYPGTGTVWNDLSINERKMWRKISDFVIENKHQGSVKLAPFIYDFYIKNNKKWFNKSWFKLNQYEKDIWTNIVYTIAFKKYQFDKFRL